MKLHEVVGGLAERMEAIRSEMGIPKTAFKYTPDGTITVKYLTQPGGRTCGIFAHSGSKVNWVENGKLTVKFDTIEIKNAYKHPLNQTVTLSPGNFNITMLYDLTSLEGLPKKMTGNLDISGLNALTSLVGLPKNVEGQLWLHDLYNVNSLKGLPNVVKGDLIIAGMPEVRELDFLPNFFTGRLQINNMPQITSLIDIEKKLSDNFRGSFRACFEDFKEGGIGLLLIPGLKGIENYLGDLPEPFKIIQKYIGKPDQLYECQTELINNGFEEFAKI